MQTEMQTSASIELDHQPTTKGREQQPREKQRLETAEPKRVPRQRLIPAITDDADDEKPKKRRQQKKRKRKPRKRPQEASQLPIVVTDYITTVEAAAYLKLSRQFLEAARYRGDGSGPPYIKVGRAVRYRRPVLDAWMAKHDHAPDVPIMTK